MEAGSGGKESFSSSSSVFPKKTDRYHICFHCYLRQIYAGEKLSVQFLSFHISFAFDSPIHRQTDTDKHTHTFMPVQLEQRKDERYAKIHRIPVRRKKKRIINLHLNSICRYELLEE